MSGWTICKNGRVIHELSGKEAFAVFRALLTKRGRRPEPSETTLEGALGRPVRQWTVDARGERAA